MPKLQSHETPLKHHYPVVANNGKVLPTLFKYRHPNNGKRKERCHARIPEWNNYWKCVDYGFCGEIAEWKYGDQLICHFHGGMIVGGRIPEGINIDGQWQ